ncbi:MAG: hypothetical protein HYU36_01615 [Planctomycetes bacterium]|nr:hypothetical protein [Planctomycetota bacterium]
MKRTKSCLMLAMLPVGGTAWDRTIGLWKVALLYVTDAMLKTLAFQINCGNCPTKRAADTHSAAGQRKTGQLHDSPNWGKISS